MEKDGCCVPLLQWEGEDGELGREMATTNLTTEEDYDILVDEAALL